MTLDDLEGYVSSFKDPVNVTLSNGDYTIYNPPPPSSGVVLDFILGVLDGMSFRIGLYTRAVSYARIYLGRDRYMQSGSGKPAFLHCFNCYTEKRSTKPLI